LTDAIVIDGLTKSFGPKLAVDNLSLRVPAGTVCGFIGPNGAGKTTTIRMIMSIIFPDRGDIRVLGRASAVESKDRIGYLPEERGVYRKMKVGAFLAYMARLKGVDSRGLRPKIRHWLDRVGLADAEKKRCEDLSKGMQQKIQFLAAILHEPDLLILDEVFSGLDPVNRRLMRELIDEQHRMGRTIIFSTHTMYEAEQLCDRVFMIHHGRKVLDDSMRDILARFDPRSVLVEPMHEEDLDALARVEGVAGVVRGVGAGLRSRVYEARLDERVDVAQAMARIAAALPVRRIELKRVSLEDVFIDLVQRSGERAPSRAELGADSELGAAEEEAALNA